MKKNPIVIYKDEQNDIRLKEKLFFFFFLSNTKHGITMRDALLRELYIL